MMEQMNIKGDQWQMARRGTSVQLLLDGHAREQCRNMEVAVVGPMVMWQREKPEKSCSGDLLFSYRRYYE